MAGVFERNLGLKAFPTLKWIPKAAWTSLRSVLGTKKIAQNKASRGSQGLIRALEGIVWTRRRRWEGFRGLKHLKSMSFQKVWNFGGLFWRPKTAETELLEVPRIFQTYSPELRSMSDWNESFWDGLGAEIDGVHPDFPGLPNSSPRAEGTLRPFHINPTWNQ